MNYSMSYMYSHNHHHLLSLLSLGKKIIWTIIWTKKNENILRRFVLFHKSDENTVWSDKTYNSNLTPFQILFCILIHLDVQKEEKKKFKIVISDDNFNISWQILGVMHSEVRSGWDENGFWMKRLEEKTWINFGIRIFQRIYSVLLHSTRNIFNAHDLCSKWVSPSGLSHYIVYSSR